MPQDRSHSTTTAAAGRAPWAVTPLLPHMDDIASGRNSAKLVPSNEAEAQRLYEVDCQRARSEFFSSETQRSLAQPLAKNALFHHYYKKHATILGVTKDLSSSETDSEDDENYKTKLFKRRMHFPIMKKQRAAAGDGSTMGDAPPRPKFSKPKAHLGSKSPSWTYRCPSVIDVGVTAASATATATASPHFGKKTFPKGFEPDNRYPEPHHPRLRGKEAYVQFAAETRDAPTNLPNPWEERDAQEREADRLRRRRGPSPAERAASVLMSPLEMTKQRIAEERREEEEKLGGRRSHSSLSQSTMSQLDRRIRELKASEKESLSRHQMIMSLVKKIPIQDPLGEKNRV